MKKEKNRDTDKTCLLYLDCQISNRFIYLRSLLTDCDLNQASILAWYS